MLVTLITAGIVALFLARSYPSIGLIVPACLLSWLLPKKPRREKIEIRKKIETDSGLLLFSSLCLYSATQAQVFITNDTRILLVPGLCRSVRDLSLHSVQSLLGCF